MYILGKGGPADSGGTPTGDDHPNYALCQLKVSQTPYCSSQYNASASGGTLEAICEDGNDELQYIRSLPTAISGNDTVSNDWPNVASMWGESEFLMPAVRC